MPAQTLIPTASETDAGDLALKMNQAARSVLKDNPAHREARVVVMGEMPQRFLFRSTPGIFHPRSDGSSKTTVRIDWREDWWDDPQDDPTSHLSKRNARVYAQSWDRRNREESEGGRFPDGWKATLRQAFEDNQGHKIHFLRSHPVLDDEGNERNSQIEIYYATDSEAIAAVLRQMIADGVGDLQFVHEVPQDKHYRVGDQRFAMTAVGLNMANAYMQTTGETEITVERKAS